MTIPKKQITIASDAVETGAIERVLIGGDLSKLTEAQRISYYTQVCESLGLNPLTRPFEYISLNGKLTLYARRDCADQLRRKYNISTEIVSRDIENDILTVHVRARFPDGRTDEDIGAIPFPPSLKGQARADAEMKCITKAKRRVTLSASGLAFLDETEVESITRGNTAKTIGTEYPCITEEQQASLVKLMETANKDWPYLANKLAPLQGSEPRGMDQIETRNYDRAVSHLKLVIESSGI